MQRTHWYLVSSHGSVLFFVAANPDCTVDDIIDGMSLTRRTVWGIVGDLRRAGMLEVRRDGRHHHYSVDLDGPFLHPTIGDVRLRTVLGLMVANGASESHPAGVVYR
jgi:DNA-binding transcriptional ArsR family regulator